MARHCVPSTEPVELFAESDPDLRIRFDSSDIVQWAVAAVGGAPEVDSSLRVEPWSPSPFGETTRLHFELSRATTVALRIYDAQGRLRWALQDAAARPRGLNEVIWNGTDNRGRDLPHGTYFFQLEAGAGGQASGSLVLLR
jgi:hypothetical protein